MNRIATGVVAVATGVTLLLGACSNPDRTDTASNAPPDAAETAKDTGKTAAANNHVEALDGLTVSFGEQAVYADGLTITVSKPKKFAPSPTIQTGGEPHFVKLVVRMVNDSDQKVLPTDVSVMVASAGDQAGDVFDTEQQMSGPPSVPVPPGGKARWVQGFGVVDPSDVSVVVQAGLDRVPVAFGRS